MKHNLVADIYGKNVEFSYSEDTTIGTIRKLVFNYLYSNYNNNSLKENISDISQLILVISGKKIDMVNDDKTLFYFGFNQEFHRMTCIVKTKPKIICNKVIVDNKYLFDTNQYPTLYLITEELKKYNDNLDKNDLLVNLYHDGEEIFNYSDDIKSIPYQTEVLNLTSKIDTWSSKFPKNQPF